MPIIVYKHRSLIRRTLGDVDMRLQDNKATNLKIASSKISHIIIKPGEAFSFWQLVGRCTKQKGYLPGLTKNYSKVMYETRHIKGEVIEITNG